MLSRRRLTRAPFAADLMTEFADTLGLPYSDPDTVHGIIGPEVPNFQPYRKGILRRDLTQAGFRGLTLEKIRVGSKVKGILARQMTTMHSLGEQSMMVTTLIVGLP